MRISDWSSDVCSSDLITVTNFRVPSASIDQSTQMQLRIEDALKSLPEVALVFSKNGNADLGTDPMPPNASDTYVIPKPEDEWTAEVKSKEDRKSTRIELQSLMRISYTVFCLKKKKIRRN